MEKAPNNLKMKFITEEPAKSDGFRGKSHSHVAEQIVDTFENQKHINNICLEGNLGSGKSTVISLAQEQLETKGYVFTTFDVEKYQHSATKKALVTLLADSISELPGQMNNTQIERAKNIALGKQFDYEKVTDSKINISTVIFAFLLIISTQVIKPAIASISKTWLVLTGSSNISFDINGSLYILFFFSPIVFLLGIRILKFSLFFKIWPKLSALKDISFGNLLKRNSKDFISEKLLVNKEVGSIELQEAFEVFSNSIPKGINYVLVLDNIDRISDDNKVRDVWSDIELFISSKVNNFKLVIPFSIKHVASVISNDEKSGMESVTKQCPVRLWVAPIVGAGWREAFFNYFNESFINNELSDETIDTCADILESWCNHFKLQITPRLLKQYINGIISTIKCCPVSTPPVIAAAYYLPVRYFYFDFAKLVVKHEFGSITEENEKVVIDSHRILRRHFEDDYWSKVLICIHFQTTEDIALSEWLVEPLKTAFKFIDVESIIAKQDTFGFSTICKKLISKCDAEDVILVSAAMLRHNHDSKKWIDNWFLEINRVFNETYIYKDVVADELLNALDLLKENNFTIRNISISNKFHYLDTEITNISKGNSGRVEKEDIDLLYRLSCLLETKPSLLTNIKDNGNAFVNTLWPKVEEYTYWEIDKIQWSLGVAKSILQNLFNEKGHAIENDLLHKVCLNLKTGWFDFSKEQPSSFHSSLFNEIPIDSYLEQNSFESLPFTREWYKSDLSDSYLHEFHGIDNVESSDYLAQALVHIIQHKAWGVFEEYQVDFAENKELSKYLRFYLPFISDFNLLIDALKQDLIMPYITEPLKEYLAQDRVHKHNINIILKENYSYLKSMFEKNIDLFDWLSKWEVDIEWESINQFSNEFVADSLRENLFRYFGDKVISTINTEHSGKEECYEYLINQNDNQKTIVNFLRSKNKKLNHCNIPMSEALIALIMTPEKLNNIDEKWLKNIILTLKSNTKGKVLRRIAAELLLNKVSLENKYILLDTFSELILIPQAQNSTDEINILSLYENVKEINESLFHYLDGQVLEIDRWSEENRSSFISMLKLNEKNYPLLYKNNALTSALDMS